MFFFLPVGHDSRLRSGVPYVTATLILACAVVLALTQNGIERDEANYEQLAKQTQALQMRVYFMAQAARGADLLTALIDKDAANEFEVSKKLAEKIDRQWRLFLAAGPNGPDADAWAAWTALQDAVEQQRAESVIWNYGLIPAHVTLKGLFGSMFLHASLGHLLVNMFVLYLVGFALEDAFGRVLYLAFYLLCGLAAGGMHILMNPGSAVPAVGASGAIAGLMGAFLTRFYRAKIHFAYFYILLRIHFGTLSLPSYLVLPIWFGQQLLYASLTAHGATEVALWAHLGGFAFGSVAALAVGFLTRAPAAEEDEPIAAVRPPEVSLPARREQLRDRLAADDLTAAAPLATSLIADYLQAENAEAAAQVFAEASAKIPELPLEPPTLFALAAHHKTNWRNEEAAALYERLARQSGPIADKARLTLARLYAGRLHDPARAAILYREIMTATSDGDPTHAVAARELRSLATTSGGPVG